MKYKHTCIKRQEEIKELYCKLATSLTLDAGHIPLCLHVSVSVYYHAVLPKDTYSISIGFSQS